MKLNYITEKATWIGTLIQFNALTSLSEDVIYIIIEG